MGHAVDKDLLRLIQYEVRDLVKECNAIKSQMIEHHERLGALEEKLQEAVPESKSEEIEKVLEKLLSFEAGLSSLPCIILIGVDDNSHNCFIIIISDYFSLKTCLTRSKSS